MRSNASVWSRRILDASVAMEDTCGEHTYCIPCAYGAPAKSDTVHAEVPIRSSPSFLSMFGWCTVYIHTEYSRHLEVTRVRAFKIGSAPNRRQGDHRGGNAR